jgi:putative pyruvate formate lyase activating enzyme
MIVPDLAECLISPLRMAGADESLWATAACAVSEPALVRTGAYITSVPRATLSTVNSASLWATHRRLIRGRNGGKQRPKKENGFATLLEVKIELARRILSRCHMCDRNCGVNRLTGERGMCGLDDNLQVGDYANLYNEGPFVGAPTFSVFLRGCGMRCWFCYRTRDIAGEATSPAASTGVDLPTLLDAARTAGARSWQFLGGNPDQSVYGVLRALSEIRFPAPIVWNTALILSPLALRLLQGIVDIWIVDMKYGNDICARQGSQYEGYSATVRRNLAALRAEERVVVRHMKMPGHEDCCGRVVQRWVRRACCRFEFRVHNLHGCVAENGICDSLRTEPLVAHA